MESRKEPEAKWGQSQCIVGKAPTLFVNSALPTQHWIPKTLMLCEEKLFNNEKFDKSAKGGLE